VVSKRRQALYQAGASKDWVLVPCGANGASAANAATSRAPQAATAGRAAKGKAAAAASAAVAGVALTHPDRVLYPDAGISKLALAQYYEAVQDHLLPQVQGRPLSLVRCPDGLAGQCFYMKHAMRSVATVLRRVQIREQTKTGEYLVAESLAGIIALVQMSVLEIHTWNSTADRLEEPDRSVFDLDPGPDVPWADVTRAARIVRDRLTALGLQSFVKTTGGKGLHVVVPLEPERRWDECLAFARGIGELLARERPDLFTVSLPKRGREDRLLVDYLRNNRTNTSVAAFSPRARPGAPVSMPIAWEDLGPRGPWFDIRNVPRRMNRLRRDPWADYSSTRQRIPDRAFRALAR
jgi:bifunctional non-homologous end joining protein LigD